MKLLCGIVVSILMFVTVINCRKSISEPDNYELYSTLNALGLNNVTVVDGLPNAMDIIRESALADMKEGSLFIFDLSDVIQKYRNWVHFMPRVVPFYSVKSNDSPFMLKVLASLGTGFDCASKGEIEKVLRIGVPPCRIIFASPTKYEQHIHYAKDNKIKRTTFDSEVELYKVKRIFPNAELLVRIRVDAKDAIRVLGSKYGCDPDIEAPALIKLASNLGLKVIGVAFHVGSGAKEMLVFDRAIHFARKLFDYAASINVTFTLLDLGGGFPGDKRTSLKEVSQIINPALEKYFPNDDVTVMTEPGRFFSASALTVACRIHSMRKVYHDGLVQKIMYFLNDGVYGSFSQIFTENRVMQPILVKKYETPIFNSLIWGPSLDSFDQLGDNLRLPEMRLNDLIAFENMGAYTLSPISNFNCLPTPTFKFYLAKSDIKYLAPSKIWKCFKF